MNEQDIISSLRTSNGANPFKRNSVKELCYIMEFLKRKIKNQKGNWSKQEFLKLAEELNLNEYHVEYNIELFYLQYSTRKKPIKTFELFLNSFQNTRIKSYKKFNRKYIDDKKLYIKDPKYLKDFLFEIKKVKNNYLSGEDNFIIDLIFKNIETFCTKKTLRNYYSDIKLTSYDKKI